MKKAAEWSCRNPEVRWAGASDITVLPLLENIANVTFLGLGCRLKSEIDPCHLMMGLPSAILQTVHEHIMDMAKPIAMLKNARAK